MPNNSNQKQTFIDELKHRQAQRKEAADKGLVIKPSTSKSSESLNYANLDLPSSSNNFLRKPKEETTKYAEVLAHSEFIKQANELQQKLRSNSEIIEKLETEIKHRFEDGDVKVLTDIKKELVSANQKKHNLQSELKNISQPLRDEFDQNFKHGQDKATKLAEEIKNAHGREYDQRTAKLFHTRNASVNLLQKNREFEQCIANISKGDLKSKAEARLLLLDEEELSLQIGIEKSLQEKKATLEKNLENTLVAKKTPASKDYQLQYHKAVEELVICKERISELKHRLAENTKVLDPHSSKQLEENISSVFEENPLYNAAQSNARQVSPNAFIQEQSSEAPTVNRNLKPSPNVDCIKLKPSRLMGSDFFSLPKNLDAKQEEEGFKVKNQARRGYAT